MNIKEGEVYFTPYGRYWLCIETIEDDNSPVLGIDSLNEDEIENCCADQIYVVELTDIFVKMDLNSLHGLYKEDIEDPLFERNYKYIDFIDKDKFEKLKKAVWYWINNEARALVDVDKFKKLMNRIEYIINKDQEN